MAILSRELTLWSPGYVYLWYDTSNGMMYLGSHNGNKPRYVGGGKRFTKAYYQRPEAFRRTILYVGPWFREVEERLLVAVDAANNPRYYNLINTAAGGWNVSDELAVAHSLRIINGLNKPGVREKHQLSCTTAQQNPAQRKLLSDIALIVQNDPTVRRKNSAGVSASWQRPDVREKRRATRDAARGVFPGVACSICGVLFSGYPYNTRKSRKTCSKVCAYAQRAISISQARRRRS